MIELQIPSGCTVSFNAARIDILFHRELGRDGADYISELDSLNQYPGVQAKWAREAFPDDRGDLDRLYLIYVKTGSPFTKAEIADAIVEKLETMGLSCRKIIDRVFDGTELKPGQTFNELADK